MCHQAGEPVLVGADIVDIVGGPTFDPMTRTWYYTVRFRDNSTAEVPTHEVKDLA